ncbi:hypothetical protein [Dysgonomonas sp. 520]|uniref:hypothetical protein n=1 Tax=Dysgonomonas sp. 520 TaxID=2302931 RepID=UPI0013D46951|nr:hypothetical protein [Dysgonomonas sp. 520]NDW08683.1 hypothetical protein [Dysgonomonas sp. 520]
MKKLLLILALLIGSAAYNATDAQQVNININIGSQPAWGPVGYDYVDYYYMPDINVYYNVNLSLFYWLDRGRWISARYLPYRYHHYDFYHMHKVVINHRPEPWRYNNVHIKDYSRYKGHRNQAVIRYSNDSRYKNSRNNDVRWVNSGRNSSQRENFYTKSENSRNDRTVRSNNNQQVRRNNNSAKANSDRRSNSQVQRSGNKEKSYQQNSRSRNQGNNVRSSNGRSSERSGSQRSSGTRSSRSR